MPSDRPRAAVLFDLDGTLLDTIDLLLESMEHAFAGAGRAPTRAQWTAGIGTPLRTQLAEWADDDRMVEQYVERYREYQDRHLESLTRVYAGVHETFAVLRHHGILTGVVTSKGRGMTGRSLQHVGLATAFDTIVTYEDTERHKPGPEPVLLALERLAVAPAQALFLGDSPHDMYSGRSAGVATAAALWGPFSRAELEPATPTYWLTDVRELLDLPPVAPAAAGSTPGAR